MTRSSRVRRYKVRVGFDTVRCGLPDTPTEKPRHRMCCERGGQTFLLDIRCKQNSRMVPDTFWQSPDERDLCRSARTDCWGEEAEGQARFSEIDLLLQCPHGGHVLPCRMHRVVKYGAIRWVEGGFGMLAGVVATSIVGCVSKERNCVPTAQASDKTKIAKGWFPPPSIGEMEAVC